MSTTTTTPAGRMTSLARAEMTLLGRSKGTLFAALFVPLILPLRIPPKPTRRRRRPALRLPPETGSSRS